MRFHLDFLPNQRLYNLHLDVLEFFNRAIGNTVFDITILFSLALQNVINDSNNLEDKFQTVFNELNQNGIDKQLIYDTLIHNNHIKELLTDTAFPIRSLPNPQYDNIIGAINGLYSFIWASTIKTQTCANNYSDIDDHYSAFDALNHNRTKRICSFCGLEVLKNPKEKRNEYDHYLDKTRYPHSSINFNNLVPMCDSCNKSPNKGAKNTIINENTGARRLAYYPYEAVEIFTVDLACNDIFGNNQLWSTISNPANVNLAFNTWKLIFNIDSRYANFIEDKCEFWLTNFNAYYNQQTPANIAELKTRILDYLTYRNNCAMEAGDFLEKFFWNYFRQIPDPDLLLFIDYLSVRNLVLNI